MAAMWGFIKIDVRAINRPCDGAAADDPTLPASMWSKRKSDVAGRDGRGQGLFQGAWYRGYSVHDGGLKASDQFRCNTCRSHDLPD